MLHIRCFRSIILGLLGYNGSFQGLGGLGSWEVLRFHGSLEGIRGLGSRGVLALTGV